MCLVPATLTHSVLGQVLFMDFFCLLHSVLPFLGLWWALVASLGPSRAAAPQSCVLGVSCFSMPLYCSPLALWLQLLFSSDGLTPEGDLLVSLSERPMGGSHQDS